MPGSTRRVRERGGAGGVRHRKRQHHRTAAHAAERRRRLAVGQLHRRPTGARRILLAGNAEPLLQTGRRPSRYRLHPVHDRPRSGRPRAWSNRCSNRRPSRTIKTLHVELPAGLTVNPLATERCTLAEFQNVEAGAHKPLCKPGTIVGYEEATLVTNNVTGYESCVPASRRSHAAFRVDPIEGFTKVPVYALVPAFGEPALNAFIIAGAKEVFLETDVAWQSDYHESFTIKMPEKSPQPEPPFSTLISRQVSFGKAGNGTYITNPTTCFNTEESPFQNAYSALFKAESYGEPDASFPTGSTAVPAGTPEGLIPTGCMKVPFDPGLTTEAGTTQVDSPGPGDGGDDAALHRRWRNDLRVPPAERQASPCPPGMGLNPSATSGNLVACTDAQFKQSGTRAPVECPAASSIGTVEIETPPLPAGIAQGQRLPRAAAEPRPELR